MSLNRLIDVSWILLETVITKSHVYNLHIGRLQHARFQELRSEMYKYQSHNLKLIKN